MSLIRNNVAKLSKFLDKFYNFKQSLTSSDSVNMEQHKRRYSAQSPTQKTGEYGEQLARTYLEQNGLLYIDSNFASHLGEIDLIMQDGNVLVFIEVKMRASTAYGGAIASITPQKLKRLRHIAEFYLQTQSTKTDIDCRLDVVVIQGKEHNRTIDWLKNIDLY